MASDKKRPNFSEGFKFWQYRYDVGDTHWYIKEPHPYLVKHYEKLNPDGKARNVLLPMCGMSVDLEWLSEKGVPLVVGVDGLPKVLQAVVAKSEQDWTESPAHQLGSEGKVFEREDEKMKLYSGDMFKFSPDLEGKFDAIWERGDLIIIPRKDVTRYTKLMKDLLNPGGRILLEAIEYDTNTLDPESALKAPPPFPMFPKDIKRLFEPECFVEELDEFPSPYLYGNKTDYRIYLIVKKDHH